MNCVIISDNMIWNPKPMVNVLDELNRLLRLEVDDGPDLNLLGEFVDGDQKVVEPFERLPKFPNDVKAPNSVMGIV